MSAKKNEKLVKKAIKKKTTKKVAKKKARKITEAEKVVVPAVKKAVKVVPTRVKTPLKIVNIPKDAEIKESKYVTTLVKGDKRMWMRGSSIGMTHKVTGIKGFKRVTAEEAKIKHLGKTRSLGKVSSQEELNTLVETYFN